MVAHWKHIDESQRGTISRRLNDNVNATVSFS